jgi:hypothetical protein
VFDPVEFPAMPSKISTPVTISPPSTPSKHSKNDISILIPASLDAKLDPSPNGTHGDQKTNEDPGASLAANFTPSEEPEKALEHGSSSNGMARLDGNEETESPNDQVGYIASDSVEESDLVPVVEDINTALHSFISNEVTESPVSESSDSSATLSADHQRVDPGSSVDDFTPPAEHELESPSKLEDGLRRTSDSSDINVAENSLDHSVDYSTAPSRSESPLDVSERSASPLDVSEHSASSLIISKRSISPLKNLPQLSSRPSSDFYQAAVDEDSSFSDRGGYSSASCDESQMTVTRDVETGTATHVNNNESIPSTPTSLVHHSTETSVPSATSAPAIGPDCHSPPFSTHFQAEDASTNAMSTSEPCDPTFGNDAPNNPNLTGPEYAMPVPLRPFNHEPSLGHSHPMPLTGDSETEASSSHGFTSAIPNQVRGNEQNFGGSVTGSAMACSAMDGNSEKQRFENIAEGPSQRPPPQVYKCSFCREAIIPTLQTPLVFCYGCGPKCNIRYCSIACLLVDAYDHSSHCINYPASERMLGHTLLPQEYVYETNPIMSLLPHSDSAEKFRQKAFSIYCHYGPFPKLLRAWAKRTPVPPGLQVTDMDDFQKRTGDYHVFSSRATALGPRCNPSADVIFVSFEIFLISDIY